MSIKNIITDFVETSKAEVEKGMRDEQELLGILNNVGEFKNSVTAKVSISCDRLCEDGMCGDMGEDQLDENGCCMCCFTCNLNSIKSCTEVCEDFKMIMFATPFFKIMDYQPEDPIIMEDEVESN